MLDETACERRRWQAQWFWHSINDANTSLQITSDLVIPAGTGRISKNTWREQKGTRFCSGCGDIFYLYCIRFVEPTEEFKKKYRLNFESWKIGRQGAYSALSEDFFHCTSDIATTGPLALAYPATIDEAELNVQDVGWSLLRRSEHDADQPTGLSQRRFAHSTRAGRS